MRMIARFAVVTSLAACGEAGPPGEPTGAPGGSGPTARAENDGFASIEEVVAAFPQALVLGESTWPGAAIGGIKIGEEVPPGTRRQVYALRVSFEFESDPADATAKSGSIVCSPGCQVLRHKVKREAAPALPCGLLRALEAARKAGLSSKRPIVAHGYWNFDDRRGITFRANEEEEPIEIGAGCAPVP